MDVLRATDGDKAGIAALCAETGLPGLPRSLPLANVRVARDAGALVGVAALEVVSRRGLVHTVAVAPDRRGGGIGTSLVHAILSRANELGLKEVYALRPAEREAPTDLFEKLGFQPVASEAVADEIRRNRTFRSAPEGAEALRLPLETRL